MSVAVTTPELAGSMNTSFAALEEQARAELESDGGIADAPISFERSCEVRYVGQAYEVAVGLGSAPLDQAGRRHDARAVPSAARAGLWLLEPG